ncbi:rRNA maturation RNase YbeY [Cyanobium sp. NS01]|uniref:rRNA maturation RNase YbeY n=1 Tax=Cyanobium sp. NS01 TaxID=261284 RepID=UPI001644219E
MELDLAFDASATGAAELADPEAGAALWQQQLERWLDLLQLELPAALQAPAYSLGLSLVTDAAIAALNQDWRSLSGPTDVLAFAAQDPDLDGLPAQPAGPGAEAAALELGDIVISLDTAERQAPEHGHSLERELLFLASHGLLHLLGWDHPDDEALAAMLARQEALLSACGPQPGVVARVAGRPFQS